MCGREVDLFGDSVDGTRLVDDGLRLDLHDMGTFLISEVNMGTFLISEVNSDIRGQWGEDNGKPKVRMLGPTAPPRVGEEMLGFNTEAQGWLPCKITEEVQEGALWTVDWWDDA